MMPNVSSFGALADEFLWELAAVVSLELAEFEVQLAKALAVVNDKANSKALLINDLLNIAFSSSN
jgi:hypothetical protein